MDGDFYVAASLATTLTKVALRYVSIVQDKKKQNVSSPSALLVLSRQHQHIPDESSPFPPHLSPSWRRPCSSWSPCSTWASRRCPRSPSPTTTWTESRCASRCCRSARRSWTTSSTRSAESPCHTCWLSGWRRRSCRRRWRQSTDWLILLCLQSFLFVFDPSVSAVALASAKILVFKIQMSNFLQQADEKSMWLWQCSTIIF